MDIFKFLIIGAFSGFINGLFSAGGGMIVVPLLIKWAKIDTKKAFATSISIILPLSLMSAGIFVYKNGFNIENSYIFLLGGLSGGIISGFMFKKIPTTFLKKALGILIVFAGIRGVF